MKRQVIVSGLPGKMAFEAAQHIVPSERFDLYPFSLSSERHGGFDMEIAGKEILVSLRKKIN